MIQGTGWEGYDRKQAAREVEVEGKWMGGWMDSRGRIAGMAGRRDVMGAKQSGW